MQKLCIVFIIGAVLTACGHDHKTPSSAGGPEKPNNGVFLQYMSEEKAECAGFRRSFRYLKGELAIGSEAIGVRLKLSLDGRYELKYAEQSPTDATLKRKGIYVGSWILENGVLKLDRAVQGYVKGKPEFVFKIPGTRLASVERVVPLHVAQEDNAWKVERCSITDNSKMSVVNDEIHIAGQPAATYWNQRLSPGTETEKEFRANVGEALEGTANIRLLLRVYSDGSYFLQKQVFDLGHWELKGLRKGSWKIVDGLVTLDQKVGVIVPDEDTLQPILYLHVDPATGVYYPDEALVSNIGSTGF